MSRRHRAPLANVVSGDQGRRPRLRLLALLTGALLTAGLLLGATVAGADPATAPPAPTIRGPLDGSFTSRATPSFHGDGEDGDTVTVSAAGLAICSGAVSASVWTCTAAPPLADGPYAVTATQTDPAGQQSPASAAVALTVDTTAPAAPTFTSPASGATVTQSLPTLAGAGEDGATVFVSEGGVTVCRVVAQAGSWTCVPNSPLADGSHTLTATQTDRANNSSLTSDPDTFLVDATAPDAPVITSPADGSTGVAATPAVTGTGEAGATLTVTEGGTVVCSATVTAAGWSCTASELAPGQHTISAVQVDAVGHTSTASNPVTFAVSPPPAPPVPAITQPVDGTLTADGAPTIAGTGQSGDTVTVLDGATTVCTAPVDGGGGWTCDGLLADGSHSLRAVQADATGRPSPPSATVTITVDTTAPAAPVVTRPVTGALTRVASPAVSGTGEDGAGVSVFDGATQLCTDVVSAGGWSCVPGSPLADGRHTLTARQTDPAGNVSPASAAVTITVDATAPDAPVITRPADGSRLTDATPRVSGTAENGATVVVLEGSTTRCTARVSHGDWSCDSAALRDGTHALTARQTDRAGNVSALSEPVTVTVDTRHGGQHGGWWWGWWWFWQDWSRCFHQLW